MSNEPEMTDAERASYWQGAYERMAARNIELSRSNAEMADALRKIIAEDDTGPMVYEPRDVGPYTVSQAMGGSEGKFAALARAVLPPIGSAS